MPHREYHRAIPLQEKSYKLYFSGKQNLISTSWLEEHNMERPHGALAGLPSARYVEQLKGKKGNTSFEAGREDLGRSLSIQSK